MGIFLKNISFTDISIHKIPIIICFQNSALTATASIQHAFNAKFLIVDLSSWKTLFTIIFSVSIYNQVQRCVNRRSNIKSMFGPELASINRPRLCYKSAKS